MLPAETLLESIWVATAWSGRRFGVLSIHCGLYWVNRMRRAFGSRNEKRSCRSRQNGAREQIVRARRV